MNDDAIKVGLEVLGKPSFGKISLLGTLIGILTIFFSNIIQAVQSSSKDHYNIFVAFTLTGVILTSFGFIFLFTSLNDIIQSVL